MGAVRCQIECYSGCVVKAECGKVNSECGMRKVMKSEPREKANRRTVECRISNVEGMYSVYFIKKETTND